MAYIIKFEEKAVKDLAELKKAGNKAAIVKISNIHPIDKELISSSYDINFIDDRKLTQSIC